jgi:aryl-alcohol dehydrogenase-like predicted oxidoreductase
MDYTRLGRTGLQVSRICLGCMSYCEPNRGNHLWTLDEEKTRPFIKKAWDLGINFYDTANVYSAGSSEEIVGKILRETAPRDEIVLATKVHGVMKNKPNGGGLSRKAIFTAIDESLTRLGMDYIDLYQIHRWDDQTPIEETLEALHDLVKAGKVRYLGASSMYAWQFCQALHLADKHGWTRFVSMQPHYNLIYREEEREMFGLCRAEGIAVLPWSPLARGKLTRPPEEADASERAKTDEFGKTLYAKTWESDRKVIGLVADLAKKKGLPQAQIALAWVLQQSVVTSPIIGATKPHHLDDAVAALGLKLTPEEVKSLEEPYVPHPVLGHN